MYTTKPGELGLVRLMYFIGKFVSFRLCVLVLLLSGFLYWRWSWLETSLWEPIFRQQENASVDVFIAILKFRVTDWLFLQIAFGYFSHYSIASRSIVSLQSLIGCRHQTFRDDENRGLTTTTTNRLMIVLSRAQSMRVFIMLSSKQITKEWTDSKTGCNTSSTKLWRTTKNRICEMIHLFRVFLLFFILLVLLLCHISMLTNSKTFFFEWATKSVIMNQC